MNKGGVKKIELFKDQLGKVKNTKDENLYFYYHALIRSLNMLSHYEQFNAGRSIFNILFPSMQLVCEHVEKIFSLNNMFEYRKEYIKSEKSLAIYLQTIDNIIYHVIHTDQKFLVIPGYTSIIYDIPARLCLFYMAFMTRVSELLKDEKVGNIVIIWNRAWRVRLQPIIMKFFRMFMKE